MSTDIVPFQPAPDRRSTLELAPDAWKLASRVADTEFVPKALRGKPEAVLACILTGHELGLSEMTALRSIHVVEGRPAMSAELMRAVVARAGHEIWTEELSSTRCVMKGSRAGSERVSTVTWTQDDARRAGLLGKNNWKSYPRAMLLARATSELCRMIFPDVLAGISHTIEELADGEDVDAPPPAEDVGEATVDKPATTTARARRAATAPGAAPAMEPEVVDKPRGDVPGLPGEDDESDIIDAEVVEEEPDEISETLDELVDEIADQWPDDDDPPLEQDAGPHYTAPQLIAMKLSRHGITTREDRLRAISAIVDRELSSSKDLTSDEIATVISTLDDLPEGAVLLAGQDDAPEPEPDPEPPARRTTVTPPEEWTADRWRAFLRDRKVKVGVVLREAQRLAAEVPGDRPAVGTLDDLAGSGICSELVGWIEEQST